MTTLEPEDLDLVIVPVESGYRVCLPLQYGSEVGNILSILGSIPAQPAETRQLEPTGDVFSDLEREMSNDEVQAAAGLRRDVQEMVAMRVCGDMLQAGSADVTRDELIDFARWLNNRRLTISKAEPHEVGDTLMLLSGCWAEQILEIVID